ncbi:MAG: hypothetical protein HZB51_22375 [Chloroflexi bacterium]|nr:hypothetical protein [Chloroflexota bacterium]
MRDFKSLTLMLIAILVACLMGCNPSTPIVIVVTATPMPLPSNTPDVIGTGVAQQQAIAATLTAAAPKPTLVIVPSLAPTLAPPPILAPPPPTLVPTGVPTATRIPPTAVPTPQSRLRNFQCGDDNFQGNRRVRCVVEYSYNGEWGTDKIYISATGWNNTPAQILEIYSDKQPITSGEGVVVLIIELHERGIYWTTQNQFCMFAEGSTPRVICQFYPYPKKWTM